MKNKIIIPLMVIGVVLLLISLIVFVFSGLWILFLIGLGILLLLSLLLWIARKKSPESKLSKFIQRVIDSIKEFLRSLLGFGPD